jgi:hypothetical protein
MCSLEQSPYRPLQSVALHTEFTYEHSIRHIARQTVSSLVYHYRNGQALPYWSLHSLSRAIGSR